MLCQIMPHHLCYLTFVLSGPDSILAKGTELFVGLISHLSPKSRPSSLQESWMTADIQSFGTKRRLVFRIDLSLRTEIIKHSQLFKLHAFSIVQLWLKPPDPHGCFFNSCCQVLQVVFV